MNRALLALTPLLLPGFAVLGCHSPDPREIVSVDADLRPIVDGTNAFAWDMLRTSTSIDDSNVFFSPFSMVSALSMLYGGANGNSEAQLAEALSVPDGGETSWHDNLGALLADLSGEHHRSYTLYAANRVWGQDGFPFEESYAKLLDETYLAPIQSSDFASESSAARDEINGWVADATRDRIPNLFDKDDITANTRLVLVNAIYFLANWKLAFDPDDTRGRPFRLSGGRTVDVPTMSVQGTFRAGITDDGITALRLTYDGDELSMLVLLPASDDGVDDLVASLDDGVVSGILDAMVEHEDLWVYLPSFEMSYDLPFVDALVDLGVTDVFDPYLSDLSGIVDPSVDQLWVQAARHKAFIRLDEVGTEAAAATGLSAGDTAFSPEELTEVHVDHPFVYVIRDDLTGTVLFTGRMVDPSAAPLGD